MDPLICQIEQRKKNIINEKIQYNFKKGTLVMSILFSLIGTGEGIH